MTLKLIVIILAGVAITAAIFLSFYFRGERRGDFDAFARCLTEKGATMYGADWCPHCQNEKNAFGDSFRLVPYVECPDEPKLCLEKGIEGYPTWILGNGKQLVGEQGMEKLSEESGCPLPTPGA